MSDIPLWHVRLNETANKIIILSAFDREDAKRKAFLYFGAGEFHNPTAGNTDNYVVTPLSERGDQVKLDVIVNI
jgi:hypothetical protein